jgi:hypothetical protein
MSNRTVSTSYNGLHARHGTSYNTGQQIIGADKEVQKQFGLNIERYDNQRPSIKADVTKTLKFEQFEEMTNEEKFEYIQNLQIRN